jgi:hypothetical protein
MEILRKEEMDKKEEESLRVTHFPVLTLLN